MTAAIVICSIIFVFFLIGCIRAHVFLRVRDDLDVFVKVLFINIKVFSTKKTVPPDPELDLPPKKAKPKKKKKQKQKPKDKPKKDKKSSKEGKPKTKIALTDILDLVKKLLVTIFKRLKKYLRVRVHNFSVCVATGDAAKTAMMFGAICGSCNIIFEILESAMDFKIEDDAEIGARCDYLSEKMQANIGVDISITVGQVLKLVFSAAGVAVWKLLTCKKIKKMPKKKKEKNKDKNSKAKEPERNENYVEQNTGTDRKC